MANSYATYEDYILMKGDDATDPNIVTQMLEDLSADLRAECGIRGKLSGDALIIARRLVVDAAYGALVQPALDGFAGSMDGVRQASFTADGMTQSFTVSTNRANFDNRRLGRLKRLVGSASRVGMVYPYGW